MTRSAAARILSSCCAAVLAVMMLAVFAPANCQNVDARDGVAAGRDVNIGGHLIIGWTFEEVMALIEEHDKNAQRLEKLGNDRGVTTTALRASFSMIGQEQVPPDKIVETLVEIAEGHKDLLRQAAAFVTDDPAIRKLRDEATTAIESGRYDEAERLLVDAETQELLAA